MHLISTPNGEQWISSVEELGDYVDPSIYKVIESFIETMDIKSQYSKEKYCQILADYETLQQENSDLEYDCMQLSDENEDLTKEIDSLKKEIECLRFELDTYHEMDL